MDANTANTSGTAGPAKYPIGYWIREADKLLTEAINKIHSAKGINRTQWQLLHFLHENGELGLDRIAGIMQPFEDKQNIQEILNNLVLKDIIRKTGDVYILTGQGEKLHAECFHKQQEFRVKGMQNINAQDYAITVNTLQQLVANLSGK